MRNFSGFKAALAGGVAVVLFAVSPSHAQNGLVIQPRVFNDFSTSTESITVNGGAPMVNPSGPIAVNGLPSSVTINDANMTRAAAGGANRDDILISTDHGLTPYTGSIDQGFTFSATISLTDGSDTPRKETGLRINSPISGDALFLINSDAGEIVAFGAGAPFYNFRPGIEAKYTPGQTITLTEQYVPGPGGTTGANPGTLQYSAQLSGGPLFTSGPLAYSNLEGGPTSYQLAAYDQTGSAGATDFVNARFTNITASVPEPASLGLLALGGVSLLWRRRSVKLV